MILQSLVKHQKRTAWFLLFIFYAEMVIAAKKEKSLAYSYPLVGNNVIHHTPDLTTPALLTEEGNFSAVDENGKGKKSISGNKESELKFPSAKNKIRLGGPGQPEMQAFQSVNTNNMVDLFSGDFSYNIPLLDVGGYPLGISYRSGATMDQEASWVGLGWNVNPGTIMRNMRGLPDDFNGTEKIKKQLNVRKNWTAGITAAFKPEIFGITMPKIGINAGAFYNNYNGPGFELGASAAVNPGKYITTTKTTDEKTGETTVDTSFTTKNIGGSLAFSINSQQGLNINASLMMKYGKEEGTINGFGKLGANYNSRSGLQDLTLSAESFKNQVARGIRYNDGGTNASGEIAEISFAKTAYTPTVTIPMTSFGFSLGLKGGGALFGFHPLAELKGYYSSQFIKKGDNEDSLPAYGYMHYQKGNQDKRALLDFNREKDIAFRSKTPHTAIPIYTYDSYSISGEGIGGTFRPYRGDVGYMRDHNMKTKSGSGGVGIDLGAGPNIAHFGGDLYFNYNTLTNTRWDGGNFLERYVRFQNVDSTYEPVYFRNPAEQTSNTQDYYDKIGGDDVVRVGLASFSSNANAIATPVLKKFDKQKATGSINISSSVIKDKRDKRSQVISYLNASEAQQVGLDTFIKSYPVNIFPRGKCDSGYERIVRNDGVNGTRKPNHISEITVLNNDGRRYIYGVPAYNLTQKEVTFAVSKYNDGSNATGLVSYNFNTANADNSINNTNGKDNYFSSETTPGYAHSFLLSGVLSPDYVDITGDGITEDDNGDAVKFNYSRIKWGTSTAFKWRTPSDYGKASYNEGFKTDKNDDKGSYVYGEKEIWYLNSVESKTMIATFILDNTARSDGYSVNDENGGLNTGQGLMRLKQINLYSKSDYYKNPSTARPVKSIFFAYSYTLCPGAPGVSPSNLGKLTLDSLWFTYNGNRRSARNKYRFTYHSSNPSYNKTGSVYGRNSDRWGNYKPASDNPGTIPPSNADYPYATQDKMKADANANAWNLAQIKLPSSAKINIEYESDDYAYVQNKRAMNMFRIAGMGTSSNFAQMKAILYDNSLPDITDCQYVFIKLPTAVTDKGDAYRKYLEGIDKFYFRVAVKIPGIYTGNQYENVPFYAEMIPDSFNVVNANTIWIKLKEFGTKQTFPAIAALQFLRLNLPGKAYPGSDVSDDGGAVAAIRAIKGMGQQVVEVLKKGYNNYKRITNVCKDFDTTRSYIRLNNPDYDKYGGGLRVKRIIVSDNWTSMTGQKESYYGQEYDYTTNKEISYDSSGTTKTKIIKISSGVATYEPNVGNEENPFRQPIEYQESVTLAPTDYFYSEYPYCESLFPAPSVGYSKVTVSSINKRNLKSFNGWEETEFFTSYDFPTVTDFTTFDNESKKPYNKKFSAINSIRLKRMTLSQGFKIDLNDMNGKIKSQKSYAANDSTHPISYTINYYKTKQDNIHGTYLSNTVPVIDSANGKINPSGTIGKDIELMMDFREQQALSTNVAMNVNFETMLFFIVPVTIPPFFPVTSIDDNRFRSAAAVKVVQRYGILDSVLHYEKGSLVSTQNMVYDAQTGDAILSRTQNEFNDPVYNFNYPAHWAYSGMEPAYRNINAEFDPVNIGAGKIIPATNTKYLSIENYLESGDELLVVNSGNDSSQQYCSNIGALGLRARGAKRLWVVDINKATGTAGRQLYIMDRFGNPYTAFGAKIKVIRSGKRNMAAASLGTVTCLKEPLDKTNQLEWKFKLDSTVAVIATGAGVYKDAWNVDNRLVSENRCDTTFVTDSTDLVWPVKTALLKHSEIGTVETMKIDLASDKLVASYEWLHSAPGTPGGGYTYKNAGGLGEYVPNCNGQTSPAKYITRGLLNFDLSFIPQKATINSARLSLFNKRPDTLWKHKNCNYWSAAVLPHSYTSGQPDNTGYVKRITSSWSAATTFTELNSNITDVSRVTIPAAYNTSQDYVLDCTSLIRDCYKNPGSGLVIMEANESSNNADQVRHLSFAAKSSKYDFPPRLFIKYSYPTVSCQDVCITIFTRRINPYVQGIWGNWRMNKSYVFYDDRKQTDPLANTDIRFDGEFKKFVPFWNFASPQLTQSNYSKWTWNSEITRFNKRGLETENKDPLGRYNSGLYGYNQTLPIAVAQNAKYRQIAFEGFEDYNYTNDTCGQRCPPQRHFDLSFYTNKLWYNEHHTGKASLRLAANDSAAITVPVVTVITDTFSTLLNVRTSLAGSTPCNTNKLDSVYATGNTTVTPVFSPIQGDSMIISMWVKDSVNCNTSNYTSNQVQVIYSNGATVTLYPSGNIIEGWQRYEEKIIVPSSATTMQVKMKNTSGSTVVYYDDIRLHPFNSNMKSFVYNPVNLRLMAELDENNYASFYEYDDEGTLNRVKKETQQGIKTIQETKSSLTNK